MPAMPAEAPAGEPFESQVREVLTRIAGDLATLIDHKVSLESTSAQLAASKPGGKKHVHIAFKLSFEWRGQRLYGALLVPLPEAITLACFLLTVPDEAVALKRKLTELDQATKDAMLEIANFIGGATDGALRTRFPQGLAVRSLGCQGLRAEQPPGFPFEKGTELIVGRAKARISDYPVFNMVLILPVLTPESQPVN
ncbi:MAG TPA: hypothetical protein VM509_15430 [Planctomycetota bacterium]|nr:hypothetical protein [Planctomycetota bacterium]